MANTAICQTHLPVRPWAKPHTARLPGLSPVAPGEWLLVDEAYGAQMAYRDRLLAERRAAVHVLDAAARPAAAELLAAVLTEVLAKPGFARDGDAVIRPDGVRVTIDSGDPLATAARLVQEDLVILEKPVGAAEHVLTGAVLCFPASWTLAEKHGRPLTAIHVPVPVYDGEIARRVQRLFDGLQPGRPIWRANALVYADPDLHQPRREGEERALPPGGARWLRAERQVLNRLPETGAVVFSIHTYVLAFDRLSDDDRAALSGQQAVT
jgi:Haem-dependent oxidative N-demethylase, alpha subunit-like